MTVYPLEPMIYKVRDLMKRQKYALNTREAFEDSLYLSLSNFFRGIFVGVSPKDWRAFLNGDRYILFRNNVQKPAFTVSRNGIEPCYIATWLEDKTELNQFQRFVENANDRWTYFVEQCTGESIKEIFTEL